MLGDVNFETEGGTIVLKCSLGAAMTIDDRFGGLIPALNSVSAGNTTAIADVIVAGSGMKTDEAREMVFKEGVERFIEPASRFVARLARGGRSVPEVEEAAKVGER